MPPCDVPVLVDQVVTVGLSFRGHELGGMGVVGLSSDAWSLTLLSPAGPELFVASDAGITTPFPDWLPFLRRMPFQRDLLLTFTPGDCEVEAGRVRGDDRRRWRGEGGPARAEVSPGRAVLRDPRRGYELVLVWTIDAP